MTYYCPLQDMPNQDGHFVNRCRLGKFKNGPILTSTLEFNGKYPWQRLTILIWNKCENINAAFFKVSFYKESLLCVRAYLCVSIPGHGGPKLTGGLTLLNPLLGVLRMMMWAVDTPWWFHFLRPSSRSQIEKLWGYYKVRGWLTLNMMTIPCWHFHFLKRPIASGGQMCLLIFLQITFTFLFRSNICLKHTVWPLSRFPFI